MSLSRRYLPMGSYGRFRLRNAVFLPTVATGLVCFGGFLGRELVGGIDARRDKQSGGLVRW